MDPSIVKLLEEDEDESMHSGAAVEAFTAALNRDIGGDTSTSLPSQYKTSFPQDNNQSLSQMYSQWQPSMQDTKNANQSQQQDLRHQEQAEDKASQVEAKVQVSDVGNKQEVNNSQASSMHHPQNMPMRVDVKGLQAEHNSGQHSQTASPHMQISGTGHAQIHEPDMKPNPSTGPQFANTQRYSGNQPVPVREQANASAPRQKQIPFGSLLPIILPELDKDRAMQLQALFTKLRKNEIPKEDFVRLMKEIVGDQMLRLAVVKMQAKSQNPTQQQHPRPSTGTVGQFSDPYTYGQLHQSSNPMGTAGPSRAPASVVQLQQVPGHQNVDTSFVKPREVENVKDSLGMQTNHMLGHSPIPIQGLTKQQQQHLHFPQNSFSMYGTNNYHGYAASNVSSPSTTFKSQSHDPPTRSVQQGFSSAHGDGSSPAVNVMNIPKVERQSSSNDPKSMPNMSTASVQHSAVPWQAMPSKEQKHGGLPTVGYVKQEPGEQALDKQPKASIVYSQGPAFSGSIQVEPGKVIPGTSNVELSERQKSGMSFPSSTRATTMTASSSSPFQIDADYQVVNQNVSASALSGMGGNNKTTSKKPISGQKKPLDASTSSPPLPSKKQKVSGAFADQSIEHLNDVTAVSGVNLREEEEQLFSIPRDDSRVSEASRKAVQEEEDRLILQKIPLQKKLAEIMTQCGLKNLSNDVERCLSLCVEERMRALISCLIRVSKQRADSEKSRHNTIVSSDVREQIMMINRKAREEWEKKQAEAEKLRKQNEPDNSILVDSEMEKDEGRNKLLKVNKDEDDKMRTTAANVAARAAVGGDDMLSKWQLMAQARQKREGAPETASSPQVGKDINPKVSAISISNARDTQGAGRKDQSGALATSGVIRQSGRSQVTLPPPRVAPTISIKDVIAVLEREPQMAKSTIIYRLYEKLHGDSAAEK